MTIFRFKQFHNVRFNSVFNLISFYSNLMAKHLFKFKRQSVECLLTTIMLPNFFNINFLYDKNEINKSILQSTEILRWHCYSSHLISSFFFLPPFTKFSYYVVLVNFIAFSLYFFSFKRLKIIAFYNKTFCRSGTLI